MPPLASSDLALTPYDQEHAVTYMRLLDADAEGADWREVAQIVLHIDPEPEPQQNSRESELIASFRMETPSQSK